MSLEEVSRSDASASASAAAAADVASENQEASTQKAQECSRKRKLGDLKQELSNKQRKVKESRQELQAIIDRKLKELRQEMVELKQEVKERERKERAAFQVTMDTQSGRRKVWRRKQGNSSAQKTSTQPRPLKRLPDNSHHSGSTEAASQ
ncbi:stress response protein NST1-like [Haliotis rufescens]|uniref:stress response protein NST1-like n=1 Tax=Haliotis rufescens TaxID=6454 RepID=UPI00201F3F55|nr:stress response protein NST1-like [Haliotis rufescens]XP_048237375.1 stress response protein NST1-like [Haliotis rufescens]XP_048237376.1 stress response protein NST1-like [Haliotis rufescens]XP_048237377.1 stress response protein NST1-like [Haliotis rufescens]XP_048237378.1 stress response protein NST1-like [Haliotis rufescens]XP_048237379.1 stress response protein NST1-like [Haliotis rufescens]XP_048237380.1 stress response protein NST1-like [Haliotis rufescens]